MTKITLSASVSVYLTGSSQYLQEDLPYFRKIIETVYKHGHTLEYDWINPAYVRHAEGITDSQMDWRRIFEDNIQAIARADMAIVNGTHYSFADGYFTAIALKQKKPVLFLMKADTTNCRIVTGMDDELFRLCLYENEIDLEEIVDQFVRDHLLTSRDLRFNFFLDREIYNHLRWVALKTGKTKATILRNLIEKEMSKND